MAVATAITAAESGGASTDHRVHAESLPLIDIRLLSQTELLSLSLSSASTASPSHLHLDADISTSKIDGSVLNVSAGSRKQTFSRLRLAPPRNYHLLPPNHHLLHHHHQLQESIESQVEDENSQVVSLLGSLFGVDPSSTSSNNAERSGDYVSDNNLISVPISYSEAPLLISDCENRERSMPVELAAGSLTVGSSIRKRGRPCKNRLDVCEVTNLENSGNVSGNVSGLTSIVTGENKEQSMPAEVVTGSLTVGSSTTKRGRPCKNKLDVCEISNLESSGDVPGNVSGLMSVITGEKRRGRPPKNGSHFSQISNVGKSNVVPVEESGLLTVGSSQRKRGRPQKYESYVHQISSEESRGEIVSSNEGNASVEEDPYNMELKRRMVGLSNEAELLGFLEGVGGEWVSSRKKRKIVDAVAIGNALPSGWKLVLCLRRRGNDLWVENRRYIRFRIICFYEFCEFSCFVVVG